MTNMRAIIWLSIGTLILAAANFALYRNTSHEPAFVQRTSLMTVPNDEISMLEISRRGKVESVLTRTGSWRIVEPFSGSADESVVLKLLDALAYAPIEDSLGEKELFKLERTLTDFELSPPQIEVKVKSGDDETVVGFGALTPSKSSVYVSIDDMNAVFLVPSNTLEAVDVSTAQFRRRTLFTAGEESVASFDIKNGSELLRFRKEGEGWFMTLPTEGPAATGKIKKLLSDIISAKAVDFIWPVGSSNEVDEVSDALLASYRLDTESAVSVTVKGVDGIDRRITFGSEASEGCVYALVHNGTTIVTVDRALKDQASLGSAAFADTRLFPYETAQITGLSLSCEGVSCLLARQENGTWRMDAPVSAEADSAAVESLLSSVLALRGGDVDGGGIEIGVTHQAAKEANKEKVSRDSLGSLFRLEDLRSLDIQKIDPQTVRRISVTGTDTNITTSIIFDRDRHAWNVESSPRKGTVVEPAVDSLLRNLCPLRASRVVKLKVTADDLSTYGLDKPWLTVAIDLAKEGSIRRNILVGDRTQNGRFATVGASDAVFVLPDSACDELSQEIVGE